MKFLLLFLSIFTFSNAVKGEALYYSCKFCHGIDASKVYLGVPAIKNLSIEILEKKLILYKNKNLNTYGYGESMYPQVKFISEENIKILAKYIKSL